MISKSEFLKLVGTFYVILIVNAMSFCQMNSEYIALHGVSNHNLTEGSVLISNDKLGNTFQAGVFGGVFTSNYKLGNIILEGSSFVNGYISKLNAENQIEWAYKIGGNNQLIFRFMKVDSNGNIFLCGSFRGSVDFNPDPLVTKNVSGSTTNITNFILKLDKNGIFVWVSTFGGKSWDTVGEAFKIDKSDNIIVAGTFLNTFYYGSFSMSSPDQLLYCIKVNNTDGKLLWAKKYVLTYNNFNMEISIDKSNNIFILSQFTHTIDIDLGPIQKFVGALGKNDIYIVKLSSNGDYLMFKNFKIAEEQQAKVLMHDDEDKLIVIYKSVLSEATGQSAHRIEKYSKDLTALLWSRSLPNTNLTDAVLNKYYDIVCTGDFGGSTSFDPSTSKYKVIGNGKAFVSKISKNGIVLSEKIINTTGVIKPYHIEYSTPNQITVAGFILGKAFFDPVDSTKFISADNKIENFIFRWNDLCPPVYYNNETIHNCAPFFYMDSLISDSGIYSISSGNGSGCLVENKLTATVSKLDATLIATQDSIFTTEINTTQYLWYNCDNPGAPFITNDNKYIPAGPGNYSLVVKDNYCSDSSDVCIEFPQISLIPDTGNKNFGKMVRLSKNGYGFVAGTDSDSNGKVDIYKINENGKWSLIQKIKTPSGSNSSFGYEISCHHDLLLISEIDETENTGKCHLYRNQNNFFVLVSTLNAPDINNAEKFGNKTAIYHKNIVISSPGVGTKSVENKKGKVYLYEFKENSAHLLHQISNSDNDNDDGFGSAIAIFENFLFVSSPLSKIGNYTPGIIHIFKIGNNGTSVLLSDRLINLKGIKDFGKIIRCNGDYLCVAGENQYSVYRKTPDRWLFDQKTDVENLNTILDLALYDDKVVYSYKSLISNVILHHFSTGKSENIPVKNISMPMLSYNFLLDIDERFIMVGIPEIDIYGVDNGLVYVHTLNSTTDTNDTQPEVSTFIVYPNPATNQIFVKGSDPHVSHAAILDIMGKVIFTSDQSPIDVSSLPSGLFLIRITDKDKQIYTTKFIKR